jgi:ABC-2 type transport system ATP-binding protein
MTEGTRPPALLEAIALTQQFGASARAVDDLTFSVGAGEVYCLLGGTGAGKTTAMRMLLGLLAPTAGTVRWMGCQVSPGSLEIRRGCTFITGAGTLCGTMTAIQNLEFFAALGHPACRWTKADRLNALRRMGIPERAFDARVRALPRELVVALWLAVAWLRETPLLLMDEPTLGIDTPATGRLQQHLLAFRERGQVVVVATADVMLASQVADRIAFLKRGRTSVERTRAEILSLSLAELYLDYVGRPQGRMAPQLSRPTTRVLP